MDSKEQKQEKNTELAPTNSENKTITPTMIDNEDSGYTKEKQDLSAIIPKEEKESSNDAIVLESKDAKLKSDGSVIIGTINGEEISIKEKVDYPKQIDIESRKNEKISRIKKKKKTKNKNEINDAAKRAQNTTSLIVLVIIAALGGFAYYIYNRKTQNDFTPLHVTVELGDKLPIRTREYVKPGIGDKVDELAYKLNTSEVKIDEVGDYEFSVTYNNITKKGTISIVDTSSPELKVKDLTITEGTSYGPETFVDNCTDLSGCNFSFEDPDTATKYTDVGEYEVYIVAKDPYENKQMKKAKLIIEAVGMVKKYVKTTSYNSENGYELSTTYDLHFTGFMGDSILIKGNKIEEYKYQDTEKFNKDFEKYNGVENYTIDKDNKIIIYNSPNISSINNNSRMEEIIDYLKTEGFTEK